MAATSEGAAKSSESSQQQTTAGGGGCGCSVKVAKVNSINSIISDESIIMHLASANLFNEAIAS